MKFIKPLKILSLILIFSMVQFSLLTKINALSTCDFFPCDQVGSESSNGEAVDTTEKWLQFGLSAIFIGFVLFGLVLFIKGAIKIIRSDGDESKIQEGVGSFKGVFFGLGILLLGIFGIIILLILTGGENLPNTPIENPEGITDIPLLN